MRSRRRRRRRHPGSLDSRLGFGRRRRVGLEASPLHFTSVALQRLAFMRRLEDTGMLEVISGLVSRLHTLPPPLYVFP